MCTLQSYGIVLNFLQNKNAIQMLHLLTLNFESLHYAEIVSFLISPEPNRSISIMTDS